MQRRHAIVQVFVLFLLYQISKKLIKNNVFNFCSIFVIFCNLIFLKLKLKPLKDSRKNYILPRSTSLVQSADVITPLKSIGNYFRTSGPCRL
jgi:hypothetical protein